VLYTTKWGIFDLDPENCHPDHYVKEDAFWDVHLKPYFDMLKPTDNVIDIGAYCGFHTVYLAKIVNHVYSVEPQAVVFERLKNTIAANGLTNVTLFNNAALSKEVQVRSTQLEPWIKDLPTHWVQEDEAGSIKGVRVDSLIDLTTPIAFIKCDAQGSDLRALVGCEAIIEKWRPAIVFEHEGIAANLWNDQWTDYQAFFEKWNYQFESIEGRNDFYAKPKETA